jgi:malate dehydrogenase
MTREELIGINAGIVKMVVDNVLIHSPDASKFPIQWI